MPVTPELDQAISDYIADPGSFQDPYPLLAAARAHNPVLRSSAGPWFVTGYAEAESVLRNPMFGRAGAARVEADQIRGTDETGSRAADIWLTMFLNCDAPAHTRLRRLAAPAFRPSVLEQFRVLVRETSDQLIAAMVDAGEVDFIRDFAYPLPRTVICRMLGVPPEDDAVWNDWVYTIANVNRTMFKASEPGSMRDALVGLGEYCRDLIRSRHGVPSDDLLGALIAAEQSADDLTEDELVATLLLLIVAGHETTVNLLGSGMYLLARDQDQWRSLQGDGALAAPAVEEAIRYEPPARVSARIATSTASINGVEVHEGERVMVIAPAVNRDERRYADPDVFDIRRERAPSLSFGFGAHFCLGAPLARLEGAIAFERLAALNVTVAETPTWRNAAHRALSALHLTITPA